MQSLKGSLVGHLLHSWQKVSFENRDYSNTKRVISFNDMYEYLQFMCRSRVNRLDMQLKRFVFVTINQNSQTLVRTHIMHSGVLTRLPPKLEITLLCYSMFVGVGTKIDPTLCRADRLVGQVLGAVGALPDIYTELEISYFIPRSKDRGKSERSQGTGRGNVCVCVCVCVCV